MNLSRRRFTNLCIKAGLFASGIGFAGCLERAVTEEAFMVELSDLIRSPEDFERKTIITKGYPEYVGEYRYKTLLIPFYDPFSGTSGVMPVIETLPTHKFHAEPDLGSEYFLVAEQRTNKDSKPIMPIYSTGIVYGKRIKVEGQIAKDAISRQYFLKANFAEEMPD